jgi:hypothetical protein
MFCASKFYGYGAIFMADIAVQKNYTKSVQITRSQGGRAFQITRRLLAFLVFWCSNCAHLKISCKNQQ